MSAPIVLVNNVYSHRNRGDSAIVEAIAGYVREIRPDAEIWLLSKHWEDNRDYFEGMGYHSAPQLWDSPMDDRKARLALRAAGSLGRVLARSIVRRRIGRAAEDTLELYRRARLIVDAGGGSLYSSNRYLIYLGLYQHLFNLWMGKRLGKPVVVAPQSIGPLARPHDRAGTLRILRGLDRVLVRERGSERFLASHDVPCRLCPDVAFLGNFIRPAGDSASRIVSALDPARTHVGVTVLSWEWAAEDRKGGLRDVRDYLERLAGVLRRIGASHPATVWIVPQVTAGHWDSDVEVSRRLAEACGADLEVKVVEDSLTASGLCHVYRAMDLFIGSRMHSCIFSILGGVPTIGLAYQPKTRGTFELLSMEDRVFDVGSFEASDVADLGLVLLDRGESERSRVSSSASSTSSAVRAALDENLRPYLR